MGDIIQHFHFHYGMAGSGTLPEANNKKLDIIIMKLQEALERIAKGDAKGKKALGEIREQLNSLNKTITELKNTDLSAEQEALVLAAEATWQELDDVVPDADPTDPASPIQGERVVLTMPMNGKEKGSATFKFADTPKGEVSELWRTRLVEPGVAAAESPDIVPIGHPVDFAILLEVDGAVVAGKSFTSYDLAALRSAQKAMIAGLASINQDEIDGKL